MYGTTRHWYPAHNSDKCKQVKLKFQQYLKYLSKILTLRTLLFSRPTVQQIRISKQQDVHIIQ